MFISVLKLFRLQIRSSVEFLFVCYFLSVKSSIFPLYTIVTISLSDCRKFCIFIKSVFVHCSGTVTDRLIGVDRVKGTAQERPVMS